MRRRSTSLLATVRASEPTLDSVLAISGRRYPRMLARQLGGDATMITITTIAAVATMPLVLALLS